MRNWIALQLLECSHAAKVLDMLAALRRQLWTESSVQKNLLKKLKITEKPLSKGVISNCTKYKFGAIRNQIWKGSAIYAD